MVWNPSETVVHTDDWSSAGRKLMRSSADELFPGGVVGYLGYGLGNSRGAIPSSGRSSEPPLFLGRYEGALAWHPERQIWRACGNATFQRNAHRLLEQATEPAPPRAPSARLLPSLEQEAWERLVRQVLTWISAGDCYQINLSRVVRMAHVGSAFDAWRRLHRLSSASHGAFVRPSPDVAILCSSPESFLEFQGADVVSRPIKGTRPRHNDPVVDRAFANELRESAKDLAELTMIVDLVRNDLGKIAQPGSVSVEPRKITAHANVHHASQAVSAVLAQGHDVWSTLEAAFPPGSVTGAPKVRACQRIAELEREPRGVYCGSIGFAADNGLSHWNVAIRTAVWTPDSQGTLRYHVGGGIVADSDPADEWRETVAKGSVMSRAFLGHPSPESIEGATGIPLAPTTDVLPATK